MKAFFLGAGASKAFGYPLTKEILPEIKRQLAEGSVLGRYLRSLLPGLDDPKAEVPLVTDVLSLIDYATLNRQSLAPGMSREQLVEFRILMERAMLRAIDSDELYTARQTGLLSRFVNWIAAHQEPVVISTNYDLSLEQFWFAQYKSHAAVAKDFDLGIEWRDPDIFRTYSPPQPARFHLYKLHGSFNWLRCDLCEHIYVNTQGRIADLPDLKAPKEFVTCECDHLPLRPVLVTPTLVRDVRDANLLGMWQRALELLRLSDEWVLIGYSLPPEDLSIRSLLVRAYRGRKEKPKITVVQHGEADRGRYALFFPEFDYEPEGLATYVSKVRSVM